MKRKLLIDENLSGKLSASFNNIFFESIHVGLINLLHTDDRGIWNYASREGYSILTKDWDYKFLSVTMGCPPKVIRMNCGNKTTVYMDNLIREKHELILEFLSNEDDCYLEIE